MSTEIQRTGMRQLLGFLLKGQRVDWQYSLVVILVITGMYSTPLVLGSIRNRVYVAVKAQIEKENNAREIELQPGRGKARPIDNQLIDELRQRYPATEVVGNYQIVVTVVGPEGSDFLTLQTLTPNDPRQHALQIVPDVPASFGLNDVVVSDGLGRILYGDDWDTLWSDGASRDSVEPLRLEINGLPVEAQFSVVARRRLPGRGFYVSIAAGQELRRYTQGFGSALLGLPIDEGLVQFALPKLVSDHCILFLEVADPSCSETARKQLTRRLQDLHFQVENAPTLAFALTDQSHLPVGVRLTELVEQDGRVVVSSAPAVCREALTPHLVDRCSSALILPDLVVESVTLKREQGPMRMATVVGLTEDVENLLPGAAEMHDRYGSAPPAADGAIGISVAAGWGFNLGEAVSLEVAGELLPARVRAFYACADPDCPIATSSLEALRLRNVQEGSVEVRSREPLIFVPKAKGYEYDEVLVYAPEVEGVEPLAAALQTSYPDYTVNYNMTAIDKLERQDARLSMLFTITITLSAIFIILALAALAQINVKRRSRQMAQMLIMGFSRRFVGGLVVAEYLFLTVASSLASLGLTASLCGLGRHFLRRTTAQEETSRDFEVIVESMNVDVEAFLLVFSIIAICTTMIAFVAATRAAKSDPLSLLD